jgi:hypothetical protein
MSHLSDTSPTPTYAHRPSYSQQATTAAATQPPLPQMSAYPPAITKLIISQQYLRYRKKEKSLHTIHSHTMK